MTMLDWWQALLLSLPPLAVTLLAAFYAPAFAERVMQQRREERDFRQAQRLVADELNRLAADLEITSEHVVVAPGPVGFLVTDEWEANKTILSRLLDADTWAPLVAAYMAITRVRTAVEVRAGQPFEPELLARLAQLAERVLAVREELEHADPQ